MYMRGKATLLLLSLVAAILSCQAQNYLNFKAESIPASIAYANKGDNAPDMQISQDNGASWTKWEANDTLKFKKKGEKIMVKGINTQGFSKAWNQYTYFVTEGNIAAGGNVMTLIDGDGRTTTIPNEDCFTHLFAQCKGLTHAPTLPANHLKARCYFEMFWYCEALKAMPTLPATTLEESCYAGMFSYCSNLTETTPLSATVLAENCYESMFSYCTSLAQAPALPAKELKRGCYKKMFYYCTSLIQAPQLPAKKVEESCYDGMFYTCESLTTAPSLPAKKGMPFCYNEMFCHCTSLNTAPAIQATKLEKASCRRMFNGCSNLKQIRVKFTKWNDGTIGWVDRVNSSGRFIAPKALATKYSENQIPRGWGVTKK